MAASFPLLPFLSSFAPDHRESTEITVRLSPFVSAVDAADVAL